jgi:hypothetical protein
MGESRRVITHAVTAAVFTAVASAIAGPAAATATPTPEPPQTVALHYSFDRATSGPVDESGRAHALTITAAHGGTVRTVPHDTGQAVAFPARCSGARCPRVVLQTANTADLNPGRTPFRYGATVLLARDQATAGQNVLQKGYSAAGGQYKLQIDGVAGKPSCALVGTGRSRIHLARSAVTVADGAWHSVECRREATALTIVVDGVQQGATTVPADLSVANPAPLRIGGKGGFRNNDQFHGSVDEVWYSRAAA